MRLRTAPWLCLLLPSVATAASDLVLSTLSGPAAVITGQSFQFSYTLKNKGPDAATGISVEIRASPDTRYDGAIPPIDPEICNDASAGTMTSGQTYTHTVTCTWPAGSVGNLYVVARILYTDSLHELTPLDNDKSYGPVQAINGGGGTTLDLDVTGLAVTSPIVRGNDLAIGYRVRNQGAGNAGASTAEVRLSTDATWSANDVSLCTDAVGALSAGGSSTLAPTGCTIPAATAPGTYQVLVKADMASAVSESNENNNVSSISLDVQGSPVAQPDLQLSSLSVPATAMPGDTIDVDWTVSNAGAAMSSAVLLRFRLSGSPTYGTGAPSLCTVNVGAINAGSSTSGTEPCALSAATPWGSGFVVGRVDDALAVAESDESNNTASDGITVNGPVTQDLADLTLDSVAALSDSAPDDRFPIEYVCANRGLVSASASTTRAWLSADETLDASDTELCSGAVGVVTVNSITSETLRGCHVPAGTAPGDWFVIAGVDADRDVDEAAEDNNLATTTLTIHGAGDTGSPTTPGSDTDVSAADLDGAGLGGDSDLPKPAYGTLGCGCDTSGSAQGAWFGLLLAAAARRRRTR